MAFPNSCSACFSLGTPKSLSHHVNLYMMNTALRRVRITPFARAVAPWTCRTYASQSSRAPIFEVFNRRTKWMQKERAATNVEGSRQADYLKDEVAIRLCERLLVSNEQYTRRSMRPSDPTGQPIPSPLALSGHY